MITLNEAVLIFPITVSKLSGQPNIYTLRSHPNVWSGGNKRPLSVDYWHFLRLAPLRESGADKSFLILSRVITQIAQCVCAGLSIRRLLVLSRRLPNSFAMFHSTAPSVNVVHPSDALCRLAPLPRQGASKMAKKV